MSLKNKSIYAVVVLALAVCATAFIGGSADGAETATYEIQYTVGETVYSYRGTEQTVPLKSLADLGYELADGKQMDGWIFDGTTVIAQVGSTTMLSAETVTKVVAKISDKKYAVTFKNGDAEVSKKADYVYGDALVVPDDPVKEGFVFMGWDPKTVAEVKADAVYTAEWRQVYAIEWYVEGVKVATGTSKDSTTYAQPDTPAKAYNRFLGWFDADSMVYSSDYAISKDVAFNAKFEAFTYKVTFLLDGTTVLVQTVAHGDKAVKAEAPEGYKWDYAFGAVTENTTVNAVKIPAKVTSSGEIVLYYIIGIIIVALICSLAYGIKAGKIEVPKFQRVRKS
jgi:hypothetical protein